MDTKKIRSLTSKLAAEIKNQFSLESVLCICASMYRVFEDFGKKADVTIMNYKVSGLDHSNMILGDPIEELEEINEKYDFVVGGLPLDEFPEDWRDADSQINIELEEVWSLLLKSLYFLKDNGFGIYYILGSLSSQQWINFLDKLSEYGYYLSAVFGFDPDGFAEIINVPVSFGGGYAPDLVVFSKQRYGQVFVAELKDEEIIQLQIQHFEKRESGTNLFEGVFVNQDEFRGIMHHKISNQIRRLNTQYKEYSNYSLADLSDIRSVGFAPRGGELKEQSENSITLVNDKVYSDIADINEIIPEDSAVVDLILNRGIVINEYLDLFFSSEMGQLILSTIGFSKYEFKTALFVIEKIVVPVPPISTQKKMIKAHGKLKKLTDKINGFRKELSLNPDNADKIQKELVNFWERLDVLTEADKVLSLVRKGETKTVEFKQTLSYDVRKKKKVKYLQKPVLKTIVGFLNSEGGVLLIGVSDDGEVTGLEDDIKFYNNSLDEYLLHLKDLIKGKIGEEFYPDIEYHPVKVNDKYVLWVECQPSDKPCFLEKKEFYVRTNPATDRLEGQKMFEYVRRRFNHKNS
jgi:hypothetical protein